MRRSQAAGKARDRKIETSPKEMDGAPFADEAGSKLFEHAVGLNENAPEAMRIFGVVSGVRAVAAKGNRPGNLARKVGDLDADAALAQRRQHSVVKLGDGLRLQSNFGAITVTRRDVEHVFG